MELLKDKLTNNNGYLEGDFKAVDEQSSTTAINYKKNVCKNYISINQEQMETRMGGTEFYVTRKYDGELNVIFYNGKETFILNRSGRVRTGLPCTEEAGKLLEAAGVKSAIIPAELYVDESKGRTRVFDVLKAVADKNALGTLKLAPFDVLEIDGENLKAQSYTETFNKITEIFAKSALCQPVRFKKVDSKNAVKELYEKWVVEENAEGLVVRSELPIVYKVKPRYTIDVAVVGFSEGTAESKGQVRSLLLAMMPEEGKYQIIGRTGNGFDEEFKKALMQKLTPKIIESRYIETDSNHVAFHMIEPEMVIELIVNDVLFETPSGAIPNPVLEIVNGQYKLYNTVDGVSFVYPIFERIREDKRCVYEDVRLAQISEFAYLPDTETNSKEVQAATSEIIHRDVYKKTSGAKLMVQKFLVWKTNKEHLANYPAYVFHYTNFSSERKEPLQRDVRVSNDEAQIMQLMNEFTEANVKKGWEKV